MVAVKTYRPEAYGCDVLVIGAGGAGLRAALAARAAGADVMVLSKVPVLCSHTAAAQGGINAALGNRSRDDWRWHAYDTVRGSDWLGDQDAIATMCEQAPAAIYELEQMGMPFTRDESGRIYQRAYGGQSTDFGKGGLAYRACAAADRTGHAMLYTLQAHILRAGVKVMEECLALDLIMAKGDEPHCLGVLGWRLETGEVFTVRAGTTIIATGGVGQMYASTTTASICTGDGGAMALRAGLPLQDMEFVQFHPTALYGTGLLISEAARAEGGMLINAKGEAFMKRYAPKYRDLASRDVVSRAIMQEIREGRGTGLKRDHVQLHLQHLSPDIVRERIPGVKDVAEKFANLDVATDAIPVLPAAHFTMGGIPTNASCDVITGQEGQTVAGLMAIGEAASTSVHGANRLGCNSLLDLMVFGKLAGSRAAGQRGLGRMDAAVPAGLLEEPLSRFDRLRHAKGGLKPSGLRRAMGWVMHEHAAIIRNEALLNAGIDKMNKLHHQALDNLGVGSSGLMWNTELAAALEMQNLQLQASTVLHSALSRAESRGAHYRDDYPRRDDPGCLHHSLCFVDERFHARTARRPVKLEAGDFHFPPEVRGY